MWDALTWQGKALVIAAVLGTLLVLGLVTRPSSGSAPPTLLADRTRIPEIALAGSTLSPTPTAALAVASPSPAASPTPPASPTQQPAATATPAPPTAAPPPPTAVPVAPTEPPPPTETPPPSCETTAAVSDSSPPVGATITLTARLTCAGTGVAGAQMGALITTPAGQSTCNGISDRNGNTVCTWQVTGPAGGGVSINACFTYQQQVVCAQTGYTPR
jgi:hypothetical protein